jgi:hypothetical protein
MWIFGSGSRAGLSWLALHDLGWSARQGMIGLERVVGCCGWACDSCERVGVRGNRMIGPQSVVAWERGRLVNVVSQPLAALQQETAKARGNEV